MDASSILAISTILNRGVGTSVYATSTENNIVKVIQFCYFITETLSLCLVCMVINTKTFYGAGVCEGH